MSASRVKEQEHASKNEAKESFGKATEGLQGSTNSKAPPPPGEARELKPGGPGGGDESFNSSRGIVGSHVSHTYSTAIQSHTRWLHFCMIQGL